MGDCPTGTQSDPWKFCAGGACTVSQCCHPTCNNWAEEDGNTCPAEKRVEGGFEHCGTESCGSVESCCEEAHSCDQACSTCIPTGSWYQWSTSIAACSDTTWCDLGSSCVFEVEEQAQPQDDAACLAKFELCRTCLPSACAACMECHATAIPFPVTLSGTSASGASCSGSISVLAAALVVLANFVNFPGL